MTDQTDCVQGDSLSTGCTKSASGRYDMKRVSDRPKTGVIGYFDGCFDIMHSGHFNAVRQARGNTTVITIDVQPSVTTWWWVFSVMMRSRRTSPCR